MDSEIDVYRIALNTGSYYEKDLDNLIEVLKEADYKENYVIRKERMSQAVYDKLPEFTGW